MFLKKGIPSLKNKTISLSIKDFKPIENTNKFLKTNLCYNFSTEDQTLKAGHGFEKLTLPHSYDQPFNEQEVDLEAQQIMGVWQYVWYDKSENLDKYYLLFLDENLQMHMVNFFDDDKYIFESQAKFNQIPYSATISKVNENDDIFFSSPTDVTVSLNGNGYQQFENLPKFVSASWFGPYLFMVTAGYKNKLVCSTSSFGLWEEAQIKDVEIPDLRGGLTRLIALEEELYLFREFGITRLSLYSTRAEIAYSHIYDSSAYIFPNTIAKSGNQIFFLSKEGLNYLEGETVRKIELPMPDKIDLENYSSCGACFQGKYYLACKYHLGQNEDGENNALLIYGINKKTFELMFGFDIRSLIAVQTPKISKLCAIFRGDNAKYIGQLCDDGKFFGKDLPKCWQSNWSDFDHPFDDKIVTELVAKPFADAVITIKSDCDSAQIKVPYSNKIQRFRTNVFGKEFQIKITSSSAAQKVFAPQIKAKISERIQ